MRKLLVLALVLALVFSMSGIGMAAEVTKDMKILIDCYSDVQFNTPSQWEGLFGGGDDLDFGAPGLYISDGIEGTGGGTEGKVLELWDDVLTEANSIGDYSYSPSIVFGSGVEGSELFSVDANCKVDVTLSADWTNWVDTPTLLLVHSDSSWDGGTFMDNFNGILEWGQWLAWIKNPVDYPPANADYDEVIRLHNEEVLENDTFTLDFIEDYHCKGPIDFTIDGALLIPKISQTRAGEHSAVVKITVGASEDDVVVY